MYLLKNLLFWKFAFFMAVLGVILWIPAVDTEYVRDAAWFTSDDELDTLKVTSGVRAAFYAMAAAVTLLVSLIPTRDGGLGAAILNFFVQLLGAWAAFFAGWYWLSSETDDNPLPYILPMVILGVITGAAIIVMALWEVASSFFNRGDRQGPANESEEEV